MSVFELEIYRIGGPAEKQHLFSLDQLNQIPVATANLRTMLYTAAKVKHELPPETPVGASDFQRLRELTHTEYAALEIRFEAMIALGLRLQRRGLRLGSDELIAITIGCQLSLHNAVSPPHSFYAIELGRHARGKI